MKELRFTSIKNNPTLEGLAEVHPDIVYASRDGKDYKLSLLLPWAAKLSADARFPLIVFVQGSAWTTPNIHFEIPQLSQYAQKGYAVATVVHRSALDDYRAPAFLQDVKTAIRFLRANAAEYHIDPERVAIWGTSSGGNTALLVGLTGDDPAYRTDEYPEQSDAVKTVVECFGPADLQKIFRFTKPDGTPRDEKDFSLFYGLFGRDEAEQQERMALIDPVRLVRAGKQYPPFLLIQGDADPVVPYEQSSVMAETLCNADVDTEMIRVEGAEHEGTFWSQQLHSMILEYIRRTL